ncbi:hypothetical protein CUMW_098040 [Citrus unshiu]|uniref:Uncharacterized protein n=1 Tax=Citrus unshiu TaxID=55188 RepID=A0A2H5P2F5_CITUN|nr:hypothetical protein CUMW_098040 [Citrus unshiu]
MPLEEVSPLPVSQLPQKPFSGKVELVFFAREAIKAKGIRDAEIDKIEDKEQDERPPFDINLAVILAGFAFESYTTPPESVGRKEVDVAGCKTVYLSESFAHEMYDGQLFIKLEKCFNLPAMDPWITHACSTGFLGTSDPYVFMELDGNSHEVLVELEGIGCGGKLQLEAAMEVLKDGYQGDVIGEATPDVLLSEFLLFNSVDCSVRPMKTYVRRKYKGAGAVY